MLLSTAARRGHSEPSPARRRQRRVEVDQSCCRRSLASEQTAADQSNAECDQEAGERLLFDVTTHSLDRLVALLGEAAVKLVNLVANPRDGIVRGLLRDVIGAVLHVL